MDYILSGDPLHVENILKENARRVSLGWVKFTPATPDGAVHYLPAEDVKTPSVHVDTKETAIADSKEAVVSDTKETEVTDTKEATATKKATAKKE